ncbi:MAG: hypothetical protein ACPGJV_16220 [Bacteriovoracaceae bacterium]
MPVDGLLTSVEIDDNPKSLCEIFYPVMTEINHSTSYYNRILGKLVTDKAYLKAEMLEARSFGLQ